MFVLTVRSELKSKKAKVIIISIVSVVVLLILYACISALLSSPSSSVYCEGYGEYSTIVENDEQAEAFCEQFSYEVEELYSIQQIYVPIEFNDKYNDYNELQKTHSMDLEPYKGELCIHYVYKLIDYEIDDKDAYMSLMVYKERVIGGHISNRIKDCQMYNFYGE